MSTKNDRAVLRSIFNPFFPIGQNVDQELSEEPSLESVSTPEEEEAKKLELEAIKAANDNNLEKAIQCLNKAIDLAPNRASGYNNRAQVHRLNGNHSDAFMDLNEAIHLSENFGGAARHQAFCQRALIHKLEGREEEAKLDFQKSAELGNEFAKSVLIQMNPYAALCNQMLNKMITRIKTGEEDQS